jgi:hypothetical protein
MLDLKERQHFSGGEPAVPESMGRQQHDHNERVPYMLQQQRRGAHVGSHQQDVHVLPEPERGHFPLVWENSLLLRTFIGFQVLTITKTRSHVAGGVQELQRICLDAHEVVVSLHGMLDRQKSLKITH